jgi:hypothetical protein
MFNVTAKHIGNGFDAAMRMPWETFEKVTGFVGPEIIKQQERIEQGHFAIAESPAQMHARSFDCGLAYKNVSYFSVFGHYGPLYLET